MSGTFALLLLPLLQDPAPGQNPPIPADTEILTTPSGLKYSILQAGEAGGARPALGSKVKVHYTGWLTDGKLFDSSRQRSMPAEFVLGQVIEGWNEGLALMTKGARYKFTIPSQLGYGENGHPQAKIPGGATLIFDVELLDFAALPTFQEIDGAKAKISDFGCKYQVLAEGSGAEAKPEDNWSISYAFWDSSGKLIQCDAQTGQKLEGACSSPNLPDHSFLKKAPLLMKPGSVILIEVPHAQVFGNRPAAELPPGPTTTWRLEMREIVPPLPIPEFHDIDPAQTTTTASGLQVQVLQAGKPDGRKAKMGEQVTCHYVGWLTNGTLFDTSYSRGKPSSFTLGQVIGGWNEGLQLVSEGAKIRLHIPWKLAYGEFGKPPKIPAKSDLVFEIELISVDG